MRWINTRPSRGAQLALTLLPFVLLIVAYTFGSVARLAENANDKLLPGLAGFADAIDRLAFIADPRTGQYLLWSDSGASLIRLFAGLGISTITALVIADRHAALSQGVALPLRRRHLDGAAAGAAADPLYRHGARRSLQDRADRDRRGANDDP
ncbi:hypothetical protein JOH51_006855 [Rhizobium leguminosarum]|nr:hypothetical protein [Rhizobium leguminosarum]